MEAQRGDLPIGFKTRLVIIERHKASSRDHGERFLVQFRDIHYAHVARLTFRYLGRANRPRRHMTDLTASVDRPIRFAIWPALSPCADKSASSRRSAGRQRLRWIVIGLDAESFIVKTGRLL